MPEPLFDDRLRAVRRDRAFRQGPELFLYERAFSDCLERLSMVQRRFRSALLIGCPDPRWPERLVEIAGRVETIDPGPSFAAAAGGACANEDEWYPAQGHDLCIAVGTLDTVNDLPGTLQRLRVALAPDSLLLGAMAGGNSLPRLRAAMLAADRLAGSASPHVHPRIQASALAGLLTAAGFVMPVVDIDRVSASYASLARLVDDLRRMGATNVLRTRSPKPLLRASLGAASRAFADKAVGGRMIETFEILHFAGWTPAAPGAHG